MINSWTHIALIDSKKIQEGTCTCTHTNTYTHTYLHPLPHSHKSRNLSERSSCRKCGGPVGIFRAWARILRTESKMLIAKVTGTKSKNWEKEWKIGNKLSLTYLWNYSEAELSTLHPNPWNTNKKWSRVSCYSSGQSGKSLTASLNHAFSSQIPYTPAEHSITAVTLYLLLLLFWTLLHKTDK